MDLDHEWGIALDLADKIDAFVESDQLLDANTDVLIDMLLEAQAMAKKMLEIDQDISGGERVLPVPSSSSGY